MPKFALAYPYFIIMLCLVVAVVGVTTVVRMPVDLFPEVKIPVVVVATFYAGMPPSKSKRTLRIPLSDFSRWASNIDHIESRSLTGVSLIKVYFQPGTDSNAALSNIANLAMADLRRLAAGDAASGGVEVRRIEPAGVPAYAERARPRTKRS